MSWKATITIRESPDPNTLVGSGPAEGTEDDNTIEDVLITLRYANGAPAHLSIGDVINVEGDC